MNIRAEMITADKAVVGMKAKWGVKKAQAAMIMRPVKHPLRGVLTPDADMMADRLKGAVMEKVPMKDPTKLHIPTAMIS